MRSHNVIIVGAGLFGSIAATLCRNAGHEVTVIDSGEDWAASKASGCVLAPSWMNSMSSADIHDAMETLRSLYKVHDILFKTSLGHFRAQRVALKDVLVKPDLHRKVESVGNGFVDLSGSLTGGTSRQKGKVLVAAGIGSSSLVEMPPMKALWGASVRFQGRLDEARLEVYAPYKQAVLFPETPNQAWFGDGTSLIESTWAKERDTRVANTVARGARLMDLPKNLAATITPKVTVGARPYVEGHKGGYFERVFPNTWVSTGGAKNGTVLAALQARRFLEALK